eukprot:gene13428-9239_t
MKFFSCQPDSHNAFLSLQDGVVTYFDVHNPVVPKQEPQGSTRGPTAIEEGGSGSDTELRFDKHKKKAHHASPTVCSRASSVSSARSSSSRNGNRNGNGRSSSRPLHQSHCRCRSGGALHRHPSGRSGASNNARQRNNRRSGGTPRTGRAHAFISPTATDAPPAANHLQHITKAWRLPECFTAAHPRPAPTRTAGEQHRPSASRSTAGQENSTSRDGAGPAPLCFSPANRCVYGGHTNLMMIGGTSQALLAVLLIETGELVYAPGYSPLADAPAGKGWPHTTTSSSSSSNIGRPSPTTITWMRDAELVAVGDEAGCLHWFHVECRVPHGGWPALPAAQPPSLSASAAAAAVSGEWRHGVSAHIRIRRRASHRLPVPLALPTGTAAAAAVPHGQRAAAHCDAKEVEEEALSGRRRGDVAALPLVTSDHFPRYGHLAIASAEVLYIIHAAAALQEVGSGGGEERHELPRGWEALGRCGGPAAIPDAPAGVVLCQIPLRPPPRVYRTLFRGIEGLPAGLSATSAAGEGNHRKEEVGMDGVAARAIWPAAEHRGSCFLYCHALHGLIGTVTPLRLAQEWCREHRLAAQPPSPTHGASLSATETTASMADGVLFAAPDAGLGQGSVGATVGMGGGGGRCASLLQLFSFEDLVPTPARPSAPTARSRHTAAHHAASAATGTTGWQLRRVFAGCWPAAPRRSPFFLSFSWKFSSDLELVMSNLMEGEVSVVRLKPVTASEAVLHLPGMGYPSSSSSSDAAAAEAKHCGSPPVTLPWCDGPADPLEVHYVPDQTYALPIPLGASINVEYISYATAPLAADDGSLVAAEEPRSWAADPEPLHPTATPWAGGRSSGSLALLPTPEFSAGAAPLAFAQPTTVLLQGEDHCRGSGAPAPQRTPYVGGPGGAPLPRRVTLKEEVLAQHLRLAAPYADRSSRRSSCGIPQPHGDRAQVDTRVGGAGPAAPTEVELVPVNVFSLSPMSLLFGTDTVMHRLQQPGAAPLGAGRRGAGDRSVITAVTAATVATGGPAGAAFFFEGEDAITSTFASTTTNRLNQTIATQMRSLVRAGSGPSTSVVGMGPHGKVVRIAVNMRSMVSWRGIGCFFVSVGSTLHATEVSSVFGVEVLMKRRLTAGFCLDAAANVRALEPPLRAVRVVRPSADAAGRSQAAVPSGDEESLRENKEEAFPFSPEPASQHSDDLAVLFRYIAMLEQCEVIRRTDDVPSMWTLLLHETKKPKTNIGVGARRLHELLLHTGLGRTVPAAASGTGSPSPPPRSDAASSFAIMSPSVLSPSGAQAECVPPQPGGSSNGSYGVSLHRFLLLTVLGWLPPTPQEQAETSSAGTPPHGRPQRVPECLPPAAATEEALERQAAIAALYGYRERAIDLLANASQDDDHHALRHIIAHYLKDPECLATVLVRSSAGARRDFLESLSPWLLACLLASCSSCSNFLASRVASAAGTVAARLERADQRILRAAERLTLPYRDSLVYKNTRLTLWDRLAVSLLLEAPFDPRTATSVACYNYHPAQRRDARQRGDGNWQLPGASASASCCNGESDDCSSSSEEEGEEEEEEEEEEAEEAEAADLLPCRGPQQPFPALRSRRRSSGRIERILHAFFLECSAIQALVLGYGVSESTLPMMAMIVDETGNTQLGACLFARVGVRLAWRQQQQREQQQQRQQQQRSDGGGLAGERRNGRWSLSSPLPPAQSRAPSAGLEAPRQSRPGPSALAGTAAPQRFPLPPFQKSLCVSDAPDEEEEEEDRDEVPPAAETDEAAATATNHWEWWSTAYRLFMDTHRALASRAAYDVACHNLRQELRQQQQEAASSSASSTTPASPPFSIRTPTRHHHHHHNSGGGGDGGGGGTSTASISSGEGPPVPRAAPRGVGTAALLQRLVSAMREADGQRCSVCGIAVERGLAVGVGPQRPEGGLVWCRACRHGGHVDHLRGWFQAHRLCPVEDCHCRCNER